MRIATTKTTTYTPEWNGNRNAPDPVRVTYRTPTLDDRRKLVPQPRLDFQISPDGKPAGGVVALSVDVRAFVETLVEKIDGLEVEDDAGNVRQIKTAADLYLGGYFSDTGFDKRELNKAEKEANQNAQTQLKVRLKKRGT